jgi:hypothetical protein
MGADQVNDEERWAALPGDVVVVLRGEPIAGGAVMASYRPGLSDSDLEVAGQWARRHCDAYAEQRKGLPFLTAADVDATGRRWHWNGEHAVHLLFGRRRRLGPVVIIDAA